MAGHRIVQTRSRAWINGLSKGKLFSQDGLCKGGSRVEGEAWEKYRRSIQKVPESKREFVVHKCLAGLKIKDCIAWTVGYVIQGLKRRGAWVLILLNVNGGINQMV